MPCRNSAIAEGRRVIVRAKWCDSRSLPLAHEVHYQWHELRRMTLRIERDSRNGFAVLKLIGQLRSGDLEELAVQVKSCGPHAVLDLDELALVDASVVRFLGACEVSGMELLNCAPYIREWIKREKERE